MYLEANRIKIQLNIQSQTFGCSSSILSTQTCRASQIEKASSEDILNEDAWVFLHATYVLCY